MASAMIIDRSAPSSQGVVAWADSFQSPNPSGGGGGGGGSTSLLGTATGSVQTSASVVNVTVSGSPQTGVLTTASSMVLPPIGGGGGAVSSVTAGPDGRLTVAPTTGAVLVGGADGLMFNKGAWALGTVYAVGDCVLGDLNDKYYVCKVANTASLLNSPSVDAATWSPFTSGAAPITASLQEIVGQADPGATSKTQVASPGTGTGWWQYDGTAGWKAGGAGVATVVAGGLYQLTATLNLFGPTAPTGDSYDVYITWGDGLTVAPTLLDKGYFLGALPASGASLLASITLTFSPPADGHISWGLSRVGGGAMTGSTGASCQVGAGGGGSAGVVGPQYFQLLRLA